MRHVQGLTSAVLPALVMFGVMLSAPVEAGDRNHSGNSSPRVSPTRLIDRDHHSQQRDREAMRPHDGSRNNLGDAEMNATGTPLRRLMSNNYGDGEGTMAGQNLPWPRAVSNAVFAQSGTRPNQVGASDFVWQWGQFLDHDIDLTDGADPPENFPIVIPPGDAFFPVGGGMDFNRSIYTVDTAGVRQQLNEISGWIDASNVYGSDRERAMALRTLDGTGRLKTGSGNLLPNNLDGLSNAGGRGNHLFLAGDVRSNEQIGLTALHTLFMREHNRLANMFLAEARRDAAQAQDDRSGSTRLYRFRDIDGNVAYSDRPPPGTSHETRKAHAQSRSGAGTPSGDEIYERARAIVAAEMQHITYNEFLPVLLGQRALRGYTGYMPGTDARIMNEFSTAAFRLGHSMLSATLLRLDEHGEEIGAGHIALSEAFFAPHEIRMYGVEPLFRGLAQQLCQDVDIYVVDAVRNFLFGDPGLGGLDLVSLNIQRGRDHGLPRYNSARAALGLPPAAEFTDISSDPSTVARLQSIYASVDDIDLWVGGLAEDAYRGGMLGELFHTLVRDQFEALRDGDRYWYANTLSREDRELVESLRLSDIIRLNTFIEDEIADNVFIAAPVSARGRRRR